MRILDDLSIFESQKAQLLFRQSRSSVSNYGTSPQSLITSIDSAGLESQSLYCCDIRKSTIREKFFQRRRNQSFLSIEYICEGEIYLRGGQRSYVAEAGDICLLHPFRNNDLLYLPSKPCVKYGLVIEGVALIEILKILRLDSLDTVNISDGEALEELFGRIRRSLKNVSKAECRNQMTGQIFELFQMIVNAKREEPHSDKAVAIKTYLERNFTAPLNMKTLAAEFQMSLPLFNKCFSGSFKLTPYQYLIRLRMSHAVNLLNSGILSVKEISEQSGYNSQLHFSSEFHRIYGVSPREFRKSF